MVTSPTAQQKPAASPHHSATVRGSGNPSPS